MFLLFEQQIEENNRQHSQLVDHISFLERQLEEKNQQLAIVQRDKDKYLAKLEKLQQQQNESNSKHGEFTQLIENQKQQIENIKIQLRQKEEQCHEIGLLLFFWNLFDFLIEKNIQHKNRKTT